MQPPNNEYTKNTDSTGKSSFTSCYCPVSGCVEQTKNWKSTMCRNVHIHKAHPAEYSQYVNTEKITHTNVHKAHVNTYTKALGDLLKSYYSNINNNSNMITSYTPFLSTSNTNSMETISIPKSELQKYVDPTNNDAEEEELQMVVSEEHLDVEDRMRDWWEQAVTTYGSKQLAWEKTFMDPQLQTIEETQVITSTIEMCVSSDMVVAEELWEEFGLDLESVEDDEEDMPSFTGLAELARLEEVGNVERGSLLQIVTPVGVEAAYDGERLAYGGGQLLIDFGEPAGGHHHVDYNLITESDFQAAQKRILEQREAKLKLRLGTQPII